MAPTEPSSVTMSFRGLATFAGRDADRTVVWLQGEHDISTTVALADTLARAIALDDADLVVDLSEVQFMERGDRRRHRPRPRTPRAAIAIVDAASPVDVRARPGAVRRRR